MSIRGPADEEAVAVIAADRHRAAELGRLQVGGLRFRRRRRFRRVLVDLVAGYRRSGFAAAAGILLPGQLELRDLHVAEEVAQPVVGLVGGLRLGGGILGGRDTWW